MRLGMENKRHVYLFAVLCAAIVVIGAWEMKGKFSSSAGKAVLPPAQRAVPAQHPTDPAHSLGNVPEPILRIGELARSEEMEVSGTGRDIFSAEPERTIEAPIAPPRPIPPPPPEKPKPPAIDVKYLGYTQASDRTYGAIMALGDDSLIASDGQIIFHRYRVGSIQPAGVQLTDLRFNNTQMINLAEK